MVYNKILINISATKIAIRYVLGTECQPVSLNNLKVRLKDVEASKNRKRYCYVTNTRTVLVEFELNFLQITIFNFSIFKNLTKRNMCFLISSY